MKKIKIRFMSFISCFIITFISVCSPVFAAESGSGSSVDSGAYDGLSGIDQTKVAILTIPAYLKCAYRATGAYFRGDADGMISAAQNFLTSVDHLAQFKKYGYVKQGTSGTYYVTIPKDSTGVKIPSEMINESKIALVNVIKVKDGYYLMSCINPSDMPVTEFPSKTLYDSVVNTMNDGRVWYVSSSKSLYPFEDGSLYYYNSGLRVCKSDWTFYDFVDGFSFDSGSLKASYMGVPSYFDVAAGSDGSVLRHIYHKNGGYIRVYNSLDGSKNNTINKRSVYTTTYYNNMKTDNSVDNSQHIDNSQITTDSNNLTTVSSVSDSYNTSSTENIINNITNNSGITDEQLQKIIDAIQRNPSSAGTGSGGSGSGGSSGGVTAIVDAIGKLLDVVAMIAGKVIAAFADFIASILKSLDSFTGLTTGFTNFLTNIFGFIPPDIMTIITTGITISILISVIKLLRR